MKISLIKSLAANLEALKQVSDLADLLDIPAYGLVYHSGQPVYSVYEIRKSSGGKRLIEDPSPYLKELQRGLNDFFQAYYHLNRPAASYGFQLAVSNEKEPRNIKTNAQQHRGKPWMINIDFRDFFHQITEARLKELFRKNFSGWSEDLSDLMIKLCVFKGRLPMGAPTSPVLANMAVRELDLSLQQFAVDQGFAYTRFVDDLTFSSLDPVTDLHIITITGLCKVEGMTINPVKTRIYPPDQPKIVTGLYVNENIGVSPAFRDELMADIAKFKYAMEISTALESGKGVNKALQQLEGRIRFLEFIEGKRSIIVKEARDALSRAQVVDRFAIVSWNEVDYHRFITFPYT